MQKNKFAIALVSAMFAVSSPYSFAESIEYSMVQQRYEKINAGVALVDSVRSALLSSYSKNNAWPVNPSRLVTDQFIGTITAPWGSAAAGVVAAGGNSYTLTLATPDPLVAQGIASKLGAVAVGNSVQLIIPVPAAASIADSMLSRVAVPGQPDRNKMFTDIDMNSRALSNVGKIDVVLINAQQSNVGSLTVETALDVKPDATFRRNVTIAGDQSVAGKSTSAQLESNYIKINGGADLLGPVNVTGDVNSSSVIASRDVVAGQSVRGASGQFNTLIVNTAVQADSALLNKAEITSLTAGNANVTGLFKALGPSEFVQDALFRGSVMVNGALTVGGIASALDIRESGILLRDKYLGIGAKAADADKLDGLDSTAFAQRGTANTFTGVNTYTQALKADGGLTVDGKNVVSADGTTLYENGTALSSKYLGINAKAASAVTADTAVNATNAANAANADKLDGLDSTAFAQRGAANTFTGSNSFTQTVIANGGLSAGGKTVISADGSTLYENGTALSSKYLGINAKAASAVTADTAVNATNAANAANADKLDGLDSTAFAQRGAANTFTGINTFTQAIRADGGISAGGKTVVSADGSTLYENGVALSSKYLGKNETAQDAHKLGGVAAASYARTDIDEVFDRTVTFTGRAYARNGLHVQNDWVRVDGQNGLYFESYGGGWHMTDSSTLRAYGGKSIFTTGAMYEYGTELSQRYLGKNDKAVSATTADNADKLGNVLAANYARKDVANSFNGLQTFNGGIRSVGSSVLDAVTVNNNLTVNGDLLFKDATGTTRTMKDTYSKVTSLETWKKACQLDVKSTECGLDIASDTGGGSKIVWSGASKTVTNTWGVGSYNITADIPMTSGYEIGSISGTVSSDGSRSLLYYAVLVDNVGSEGGATKYELAIYGSVINGSFGVYYLDLRGRPQYYNMRSISKI